MPRYILIIIIKNIKILILMFFIIVLNTYFLSIFLTYLMTKIIDISFTIKKHFYMLIIYSN